MNEWDQTYTGKKIIPRALRVDDVDIEDIAHPLAMMCRYGGYVSHFYSVAEHSVLVSEHVDQRFAREALLHDACEAGAADFIRWLKRIPGIKLIVKGIERQRTKVIYKAFGIESTHESARAIDEIDKRIVVDEINELKMYPRMYDQRYANVEPVGAEIIGLSPEQAEVVYMLRFYELFPEYGCDA